MFPLQFSKMLGLVDLKVTVHGGGPSGHPSLDLVLCPGIVLTSANDGQTQHKTSVILSADVVLQGNYHYSVHGGVIVAIKYFKTKGATNILEYSFLMLHQH